MKAIISFLFATLFLLPGGSVFAQTSQVQTITTARSEATGLDIDARALSGISLRVGSIVQQVPMEEYRTLISSVPYMVFDPDYSREVENEQHCPEFKEPCFLRMRIQERSHLRKESATAVSTKDLREYLEAVADSFVTEPVNAVLAAQGGQIIVEQPHQDGYTISLEDNVSAVSQALMRGEREITLASTIKQAEIRSDNYKELGLETLIGEGRSNFAGSSVDRIHNIKVAAERFDDLIIPPGGTFSFVEHLGAVDGSTGYRQELVIKDNQTKKEYGGGVCQVSTTIFRGAIFTGMKITERRNHSYPVKYYEPMGFDATIYLPAPDMKFENNTDGYIMLDTEITGDELVFYYYGRDDGRNVVMDGPHVTERGNDGSAKTYFTQKVTSASGDILIDDSFYSNYKSPDAYPRVGDTSLGGSKLTQKPDDWSKKQWKEYREANGI